MRGVSTRARPKEELASCVQMVVVGCSRGDSTYTFFHDADNISENFNSFEPDDDEYGLILTSPSDSEHKVRRVCVWVSLDASLCINLYRHLRIHVLPGNVGDRWMVDGWLCCYTTLLYPLYLIK